jgi:hypothetical protein
MGMDFLFGLIECSEVDYGDSCIIPGLGTELCLLSEGLYVSSTSVKLLYKKKLPPNLPIEKWTLGLPLLCIMEHLCSRLASLKVISEPENFSPWSV